MEIIKKIFDGIEYYLIDIYDNEFPFGTVYHFTSGIRQKYCFYQENMYIPIENKKYLKKIEEKLDFNPDIIYKTNLIKEKIGKILRIDLLHIKDIFTKLERLKPEEEYKLYDEVSKIITELYPDISYTDTMKVLYDDSGIYYSELPNNIIGNYNLTNNIICLNSNCKDIKALSDTVLHESIHKLTNRNGFIKDNMYYIGLIEAGTAKICENKYGDKTSNKIFGGNNEIHVNFSSSSYQLAQVIYRQMAQLVDVQMADEELINGSFDIFLDKFEKMYGKDLLLYLSHRTKRLALDNSLLSEEEQIAYLEQAQDMLLTRVFDQKLLDVKTEEDMINYMAELKNFEYTRARIKNYYIFDNYYIDKYNYIMELARKRGINTSKLEEFEYSPVEFLPVRNNPEATFSEITQRHIEKICHNQSERLIDQKLNLEECTRIQINNFPNCYCLDILLQDGLPISAINGTESSDISIHDKISDIYQDLGVDCNKATIYEVAYNTYMVINNDGTSEIYSISSETSKIYKGIEKQVDLGFTLKDIEKYTIEFERSNIYHLLHKFRNFLSNLFYGKHSLALPENTVAEENNSTDNPNKNRKLFLNQLNPNSDFYKDNPVTLSENSKTENGERTNTETESDKEISN